MTGAMMAGRGKHMAAIAATVALVAVIVAGVMIFGRSSSRPSAGGTAEPTASGTSTIAAAALDHLAADAPCGRTQDSTNLADQAAIRAFHAVAAVNCAGDNRDYPGEGQWQVLIRQVLPPKDLDALLAGLTQPDRTDGASPNTACATIGYVPLSVLLVDADGSYLHPSSPHDYCGAPLAGASFEDISKLPWRTVSVARVHQIESQGALDTGCEQQYKNMVEIEAATLAADPGSPVFAAAPNAPLTACLYRPHSDPEVGDFERGLRLAAGDAGRLRTALAGAGAGPKTTCAPQPEFAVIHSADGGVVYLELGGCWRVNREDKNPATVGSADAAVVKALLKVP